MPCSTRDMREIEVESRANPEEKAKEEIGESRTANTRKETCLVEE